MSRWLSTFLRRFYFISRVINWDFSQSFHIKMSIVALFFAKLHALGHLARSFVFGSMAHRQDSVAVVLGADAVPRSYIDYVRSLAGWTSLTAISCCCLLTALSVPRVRKWSYEVFQMGHLLMFLIVGLMIAHVPTLFAVFERTWRVVLGFRPIEAELELLDEETTMITVNVPHKRPWDYKAGQYVLVQVPQLPRWQWHPFTVSTCVNNRMQVHIKADGDWTNELRDIAKKNWQEAVDQAWSLAGIGVTPFSGVLTDLRYHELERVVSGENSAGSGYESGKGPSPYQGHPRVDFHWMVRDKNNLLWFSNLLNEVSRANELDRSHLGIRTRTYVTQKRKQISELKEEG
ncbi:hypothetical protein BU25DRAFT_492114 [Macroventuria anomochaeta]|uniref:Uncharacterized protein n=1 Tax=Macroventuria anomochaeta TaxID=301207 RepID=A0ACB6RWJ1_9PLEO|nr:uncharacterized protein BU25DRAFT_492114 [Macroventuria anomochaeta]KAF2626340.1 hypothetical protein BU25DRAFT_492114 [Macroventuria anomochaeta]